MLTLGGRLRPSFAFEPPIMRLTDDARRSVVFLGHMSDPNDPSTFKARATGFFVRHDRLMYLVTAAHVAVKFADDPFYMRLNKIGGDSVLVYLDPATNPLQKWYRHPDPSVDVATLCFPYDLRQSGYDHIAMSEDLILDDAEIERLQVGPGDTCYAVGLFALLQGSKRSVPVVHRGSIAAMPSDELIPIRNWCTDGESHAYTRAYLVEATNLQGLSGSPVMVRATINVMAPRLIIDGKGPEAKVSKGSVAGLSAPSSEVSLLGIWSASWDARPDQVLSIDQGHETRVPLGLGVVVPAARLEDLFQSEPVKKQHQAVLDQMRHVAELDAIPD